MTELSRRGQVEPFHAMDVLAEAIRLKGEGRDIISMAVGQPSHPAPRAALDAARTLLDHGRIGYTDSLGTEALKRGIAGHYRSRYDIDISPRQIAVTTGSSAAFNLAFLALFDTGDWVAIARPGYPAYRNILKALGLNVLEVACDAASGFTLTPESLELAEKQAGCRLRGVLLASPANPTGTVTGRDGLRRLAGWCADHGVHFISDEIYHGLTFAGEETSALEVSGAVTVINSFSKYYCMTGWRIGWMVLPEEMVRTFECLSQSLYISPPELSQVAALAALGAGDELEIVKDSYRVNRDTLMHRLPAMGLDLLSPADGAFYAYVDVRRYTNDSMAFAKAMLAETGVAATPGIDFDPLDGHAAMRFSYAVSQSEFNEALDRMDVWLRSR